MKPLGGEKSYCLLLFYGYWLLITECFKEISVVKIADFFTLQLSFYYPQVMKLISLLNSCLIHSVPIAPKKCFSGLRQNVLTCCFVTNFA